MIGFLIYLQPGRDWRLAQEKKKKIGMNKTAFSPLSSTPTGPTRPAHTLSGFFLDVAGYEIKEMPLAVLALREQEGIGIAA